MPARDMNAAGLRMVGAASIDVLRGNSVLDLIDPRYQPAFVETVERVSRGTTLRFELNWLDGTRRWMEQHAAPLFDPAHPGKVCEMIAVTRDMTERVRMEQSSRKSASCSSKPNASPTSAVGNGIYDR